MFNLPVIICIGTPKVSGDSLGPKVGEILKSRNLTAFIYGDGNRSVNALNFREYCSFIRKKHTKNLIIAVDAGLSSESEVGSIKMSTAGVSPGGALAKELGSIGNIGVLGIVGTAGKDNMTTLLNVERDFVNTLAQQVADRVESIVEKARVIEFF